MPATSEPTQPHVRPNGLSKEEAAQRLRTEGPNTLPNQGPRRLPAIVLDVLREPMFMLLLAAAALYLLLGDIREALVLLCSVFIIIVITVLQAQRTEHALARLRDLSSPRALVIRDGEELRIAGVEVVRGDLMLLNEGDRVPADARLLSATTLSVDESILTGESLPVDKQPSDDAQHGTVYSGSLIVRGFGMAEVTATGARTGIGKIGKALSTLQTETTPLYREVNRIVRWLAVAGVLLCVVVALFHMASSGNWVEGVLAGITLAMGVLPEEFPVVLTVFLAMGAWRISRHGVLTRRMPAIESLGAATVLAVDKTGTLTENRMQVAVVQTAHGVLDLRQGAVTADADAQRLLLVARAASEHEPFDPMEQAIHRAADAHANHHVEQLRQQRLVREYDLTPELLAVTHVWSIAETQEWRVAIKGAPEAVFGLCRLPDTERQRLMQEVERHAQQGLRVLAVASGTHPATAPEQLPEVPHDFTVTLLGLLCLADPLRATVPAALRECRQAGIRVVMITGDHPGTALAIATQAGFDVSAGVMTGTELSSLPDEALRERIRHINLFARTLPEQKLRLVEALKANGEVVAMTGDGVNDAPALKAAHVGVAMGGRGTDVAREAAALILVHDDFASLVTAVRLGRRIYDNIRHAMSYLIAVHIPIAGMGLLPVLFHWPLLLMPVHVLFMEFVIDPACSFIFEADEAADDVMRRKPRGRDQALFTAAILWRNVAMGVGALLFALLVYVLALRSLSADQARTLGFSAMVIGNLLLIFTNRARHTGQTVAANRLLWGISSAALMALAIVIYVPAVAALFRFEQPPLAAMLGMLVIPGLAGLAYEWQARRFNVQGPVP